MYIYIIAKYSSAEDDGLESVLDAIFNLLAYQFITTLDDIMYPLISGNLRIWCNENGYELNQVFTGHIPLSQTYNLYVRFGWITASAVLLTALHTQSSMTTGIGLGIWLFFSVFMLIEDCKACRAHKWSKRNKKRRQTEDSGAPLMVREEENNDNLDLQRREPNEDVS